MITVSPVSWSDLILKVGSSSERRLRAMPIFSWSALVFGSIRKEITGSENEGISFVREGMRGFSILKTNGSGYFSREYFLYLFSLVCLQAYDATKSLLLESCGVVS